MSLSDKSREKCKQRIAEIRDGATSVLEVLSKPNVDWVKAARISGDVCESADNLDFICTVKMLNIVFYSEENHDRLSGHVVVPRYALDELMDLAVDLRIFETVFAKQPDDAVDNSFVSGLFGDFADELLEVVNTFNGGDSDD